MRVFFETLEERRLMSTLTVGAGQQYTTLQAAANAVKAGDTVVVQAGNYAGFQILGSTTGTSSAHITFDFLSGAKVTSSDSKTTDAIDIENANYVTIEGATVTPAKAGGIARAGIRLANCNNCTIENNYVSGMGYWGIYTSHSNYIVIQNNTAANSIKQHGIYVCNSATNIQILNNKVFGNADCGIHINGDGSQGGNGVMSNLTISGNLIYNNGALGGSAINCDGLQNSIIENNLIYNNKAKGIALYKSDSKGSSINDIVVNNTVIGTNNSYATLEIIDGSTGATVFNNILLGSQSITASYKASNNTTSGSTSSLFAGASSGNYALSSSSAAIGAGVATYNGKSAPSADMYGTARGSRFDAGAIQFSTTAITAAVTTAVTTTVNAAVTTATAAVTPAVVTPVATPAAATSTTTTPATTPAVTTATVSTTPVITTTTPATTTIPVTTITTPAITTTTTPALVKPAKKVPHGHWSTKPSRWWKGSYVG